jgi:hypothetical protein
MAVRATVSRFPAVPEALESCALQWGVAVTPFAAADERGQRPATGGFGDRVPRCESCWGYFNSNCDLERWGWACALCGTLNGFDDDTARRFQRPDACPELNHSFIDLEIPGETCCFQLELDPRLFRKECDPWAEFVQSMMRGMACRRGLCMLPQWISHVSPVLSLNSSLKMTFCTCILTFEMVGSCFYM